MIKATLRRLHSPDVADLTAYVPVDPARFGVLVQAMVGPKGEVGEESCDFVVCSPAGVGGRLAISGYEFGRHYLIVARYDAAQIEAVLRDLCDRTAGPDWPSLAAYLAQYGKWEFEDYMDASAQ
jgi:hypothetical protein